MIFHENIISMKKIYKKLKYKNYIRNRVNKKKRKKKYIPNYKIRNLYKEIHQSSTIPKICNHLYAPSDCRFIYNTEDCISFIKDILDEKNISVFDNKRYIYIDFSNIEHIDYAMISVLVGILEILKKNRVSIQGNFPNNEECKKYIEHSGFLNNMFDLKGKKYRKDVNSEIMFFEKGNILSNKENSFIGGKIKKMRKYLTGEEKHFNPLKTIFLEICGNTIEHSVPNEKGMWFFGVKYEDDRVVCNLVDFGRGILDTLKKKFSDILYDNLIRRDEISVLNRAFIQKYGSKTKEKNRNKGLPSIKENFEKGKIYNMVVITNNVILHFGDSMNSRELKNDIEFGGTFYQWEITKESFK